MRWLPVALLTAAGLYSLIGPEAVAQNPPPKGGIEIRPDAPKPPAAPAPPALGEVPVDVDSIQDRIQEERERLERQQERLRQLEAQLRRDRVIRPRGDTQKEEDYESGDGALVRMGQDVEVGEGEVAREVVVMGGNLVVRGEVEGNAVAIGGDLTVEDGGRVAGDVVTVGGKLNIHDGAIVEGDQVEVGTGAALPFSAWGGRHWETKRGEKLVCGIVVLLAFLLVGWIAMLLFGTRMTRMADLLEQNLGRSVLLGFLVLILWLPTVVLTCITVIGIPVAIFILVAVPFAAFAGYLIAAMVFGRRLASGLVFERSGPLAHLLIGLTALAAFGLVGNAIGLVRVLGPLSLALRILGWVLVSFAAIGGLGALAAATFENIRFGRRAGESPPGAGGGPASGPGSPGWTPPASDSSTGELVPS